MPPKRSDHGLFFEYDADGRFRAGAFGSLGVIGLVVIFVGFEIGKYLGLW